MMPYPFIVESIPLQYRRNNRIASCCNYRSENFQYHPTLDVGMKKVMQAGMRLNFMVKFLLLNPFCHCYYYYLIHPKERVIQKARDLDLYKVRPLYTKCTHTD